MYILTVLLTLFSFSAQAQDSTNILSEIHKQMALRVSQGVCQKEWADDHQSIRIYETKAKSQKIYAATCSLWSHNQAWSLFLVVDSFDNKKLIKPLFFIRHSSYKGLYADSVVENISWDASKKILTSKKYLNGNQHCGELAGYQWNESNQDFSVVSIYKNDDCTQAGEPWDKVL